MPESEITFAEQEFTGKKVDLVAIRVSHDGSMIGLELTTADSKTHCFVLPPVIAEGFLKQAERTRESCAIRSQPPSARLD